LGLKGDIFLGSDPKKKKKEKKTLMFPVYARKLSKKKQALAKAQVKSQGKKKATRGLTDFCKRDEKGESRRGKDRMLIVCQRGQTSFVWKSRSPRKKRGKGSSHPSVEKRGEKWAPLKKKKHQKGKKEDVTRPYLQPTWGRKGGDVRLFPRLPWTNG